MNILIPIGGRDKYFPESVSVYPKPLIDIAGRPLVDHTLRRLLTIEGKFRLTFVVQEEDCQRHSLDDVLRVITHGRTADIIKLRAPTQGAICSCLMAIDHLDPNEELIVTNSDQVLLPNLNDIIANFRSRQLDSGVVTFASTHPRFSYVRTDPHGRVVEAEEKRVISRLGIAGFYYFQRSADFVRAAKRVLINNNPIHGSFFISQALNEMILDGKTLGHYQIPPEGYYPLYSPQKIAEYEDMLQDQRITAPAGKRPVLVVPMAGEGSRFAEAGYKRPKPFIDVAGMPMIRRVLDNLQYGSFDTVLIARAEHVATGRDVLNSLTRPGSRIRIVSVDHPTEGAACTVLLARAEINRGLPLMIANCDQIVDIDLSDFVQDCVNRELDGSILVFREPNRDPKWSYALPDSSGLVTEVREKVAISDLATVGIYYFRNGGDFIDAALDMIANNDRVNNEFYTCPVYNYMIAQGKKIGVYEIERSAMHGIGIPDDLRGYLKHLGTAGIGRQNAS